MTKQKFPTTPEELAELLGSDVPPGSVWRCEEGQEPGGRYVLYCYDRTTGETYELDPETLERIELLRLDGVEHARGSRECPECWDDYPVPCTVEGCDGLAHAQFFEAHQDGYVLIYLCDQCGETGEP